MDGRTKTELRIVYADTSKAIYTNNKRLHKEFLNFIKNKYLNSIFVKQIHFLENWLLFHKTEYAQNAEILKYKLSWGLELLLKPYTCPRLTSLPLPPIFCLVKHY